MSLGIGVGMAKPKALVLRTAGTNCDKETAFAFELAGGEAGLKHINNLRNKKDLSSYQIIAIPGGFSYGDDLGAGKILSLELLLWLQDELKKFINRGGLIIGICNGFQVLVKTGLLPDLDFKQKVTLTFNDSHCFQDQWVYLKPGDNLKNDVWLKKLPEVFTLPIAHGEGKFYAKDDVLKKLKESGQIAVVYHPVNPNGSLENIAGITDKSGKILGLMPHPERCMFTHQLPLEARKVIEPFGLTIFKNAVNHFI